MITTAELGDWLEANGLAADVAIRSDGQIPEMPDRAVVLTRTGGQPPRLERGFDVPFIQVITRDGQGDPSAALAEALAQQVDDILMSAVPPVEIGGQRVISIDYVGGPPAFLDRDDAERVLYVCSYALQVARAVH